MGPAWRSVTMKQSFEPRDVFTEVGDSVLNGERERLISRNNSKRKFFAEAQAALENCGLRIFCYVGMPGADGLSGPVDCGD
jgi:hypothetical protein